MKTLAERLVWARKQLNLTQTELAKMAGVTQSTIGNLESGTRQTARNIARLAGILQVSALWLSEGIGDSKDLIAKEDRADYNVFAIDDADQNPIVAKIRKVKLRLSAGIIGFSIDAEEEDGNPIFFRKDWLAARGYKAEKLIAIHVKGDSMEPNLHGGDIVVINTADTTPRDGDVFAVNYEGEDVVKRLVRDAGTWWLLSDNSDQRRFGRKECAGDMCLLIGKVIHKQSERI